MQDTVVAPPTTLAEALDPAWLTHALSDLTGGAPITQVEAVEKFHTVATKQRFRVEWADGSANLCFKAFLDANRRSSENSLMEHRFYRYIAPQLKVRIPDCVTTVIDDKSFDGITIMRDLVADGARFGSALEAVTPDQASQTIEQLAVLHSHSDLLGQFPWVRRTLSDLLSWQIVTEEKLQENLDDSRGVNLLPATRDARRLNAGLAALATACESLPTTAVHGDAHAGNIYWTAEGPGVIDWQMIQHGHWSLDVAYQICAILPADVAAAHEFELVDHYLGYARTLGVELPDRETAHRQYRQALVYAFYMWAVTTRVVRPIIDEFSYRLGRAVERNDSYAAVGV